MYNYNNNNISFIIFYLYDAAAIDLLLNLLLPNGATIFQLIYICHKYVGDGYLKIFKQVWCWAVVFQNQAEMSIR